MTALRDELATTIQKGGDHASGTRGGGVIDPTKAADAAIADGWTKHRKISTPQERELLSAGAVLRDAKGRVMELMWDDGGTFWNAIGDADFCDLPTLPAVILDEATS